MNSSISTPKVTLQPRALFNFPPERGAGVLWVRMAISCGLALALACVARSPAKALQTASAAALRATLAANAPRRPFQPQSHFDPHDPFQVPYLPIMDFGVLRARGKVKDKTQKLMTTLKAGHASVASAQRGFR